MPAFRIPNATAYGRYANFQTRTDNLFADQDATPNISNGTLFWTQNSTATSITYFDGQSNGVYGPEEGQTIIVGMLDGNTTFVASSQLRLEGAVDVTPAIGAVFHFIYRGSAWFELFRSYNTANLITVTSSELAAGVLSISPAVVGVSALAATGSNMIIRRMTGGYTGQRVAIQCAGSSVTFVTNSAGATDSFVVRSVGGTSAIMTGTTTVLFQRGIQGTTAKWFEVVPIAAGSA